MELLTNQTLWQGYDPTAEQLDVTVARVEKKEKYTLKKVYFTGRTFADGTKTRVCANICIPNRKTKHAVLLIGKSDKSANNEELQDVVKSGFIAMNIDIDGRTASSCGTMYPEQVSYCNAVANKDMFYFENSAKESKIYEQSLNCMRAITYLYQEEKIEKISVVTVGECSTLGAIVCAVDKRVTNGAFMFGKLHIDYPEQVVDTKGDNKNKLSDQLAYEEIAQAWTMALAPQSYAIGIDVPIYVINSANSPVVDIMEVSKMYFRVNDQSRLLVVPDAFDCVGNRYINSVIAWCKGTSVDEDYDLSYFVDDNGDYYAKLVTSAPLKNTAIWYCANAQNRAKHWVPLKVTQGDGCYVAKLNVYDANCKVVLFAEIDGKVVISTNLLEIEVKNAKNVTQNNSIVYRGDGNYDLITVGSLKYWMFSNMETKRKKGYLGIMGAQGTCLATFAIDDVSVRKTRYCSASFDICSEVVMPLNVYVVCNYGTTNDIYSCTVNLVGDGKWQRITVDNDDFRSVTDGKHMSEGKLAQLLVLKADQSFLVNNIILV